jgi:Uma2 family endonuclease
MNRQVTIDRASATRLDERLFTVSEFARMIECGAFEDMRVELVDGVLEQMSPAHGDHGSINGDLYADLRQAYRGAPVWLAIDLALRMGSGEVRGPDIAVVREDAPKDKLVDAAFAILLVEIAKSTLGRDLGEKTLSYGRAGVPEYWVVDLPGRVTHIFTQPFEEGYAKRQDVPFGTDMLAPGANGSVKVG